MSFKSILIAFLAILLVTLPAIQAGEGPNNGEGIIPRDLNVLDQSRVGTESVNAVMFTGQGFGIAALENNEGSYREVNRFNCNGNTAVRYQYTYKGIPVLGSEVVVNMDTNNEVFNASGFEFKVDSTLETSASISLEEAVATATPMFNSARSLNYENDFLAIQCTDQGDFLVWNFELYDGQELRWQFMVDAHDGTVRGAYNLIQVFALTAQTELVIDGETKSQKVTIGCSNNGDGNRLASVVNETQVRSYNMKKSSSSSNGKEDDSQSLESWDDPIVGTAHYNTEQLVVFLQEVYNRKSLDNKNFTLKSRVRYSNNYDNAFWNGSLMTYGDGSWNGTSGRFSPLCVADVVSHELTHGITSRTSNLVYRNESGAMNESMSDIVGNSFEFWLKEKTKITGSDWTKVGEECVPEGSAFNRDALRYMDDPTKAKHPKEYKGAHWYSGWGDNGGVHTNSGVGNRTFYVTAAGATQNGVTVQGVGVLLASKIFHFSNVNYLTSNSTYKDWPAACLKALDNDITDQDISKYGTPGITREQVRASVTNAWKAVKVLKSDDEVLTLAATSLNEEKSRYLEAKGQLSKSMFLQAGTSYTVSCSFEGKDADLYVFDANGMKVASSKEYNKSSESITFTPATSGLFSAKVCAFQGQGMASIEVK